jgi:hypothetical protein
MKHFEITQNTDEWMEARAGVATASCFNKVLTKTMKPSAQADPYAYKLMAELILGRSVERGFSSYAIDWGNAYEEEAIKLYEFRTGLKVAPGGFYTNDDMTVGASPDARCLDGDNEVGGAEIKCPEDPAVHMEFVCMDEMNPNYIPQVQGQLFVTGWPWVDWFSFYPELPYAHIRTYRDEQWQAALENALGNLTDTVKVRLQQLYDDGHIDEIPVKRIIEPQKPEPKVVNLNY